VWALPLAALMIVAYLAIQWVSERGEIVTVTFIRSAGARAGETQVTYQGVEAGHLINILPNKDGHRVFSLWPGGGPSFRRIEGKRCSLQNAGGICAVRNHGGEGHTSLRRWLRDRRHHCGVVGIRDASGRHRFWLAYCV